MILAERESLVMRLLSLNRVSMIKDCRPSILKNEEEITSPIISFAWPTAERKLDNTLGYVPYLCMSQITIVLQ